MVNSGNSVQEKVARVSAMDLILEGIRRRPSIGWDIEKCDTCFYIILAGGYRLLVTILMDRLIARTVEITLYRNGKPIKNQFGFEDKNSNRNLISKLCIDSVYLNYFNFGKQILNQINCAN